MVAFFAPASPCPLSAPATGAGLAAAAAAATAAELCRRPVLFLLGLRSPFSKMEVFSSLLLSMLSLRVLSSPLRSPSISKRVCLNVSWKEEIGIYRGEQRTDDAKLPREGALGLPILRYRGSNLARRWGL